MQLSRGASEHCDRNSFRWLQGVANQQSLFPWSDVGIKGNNHLRCFTYLCHLVCNRSGYQGAALVNGEGQSHRHESGRLLDSSFSRLPVVTHLDMFLQILRTLESLSTEIAFVWLQWNMDSDVRGDMVTLHSGGAARVPTTCEIQVVCALSSDMLLTDMLLLMKLAGEPGKAC